MRSDRRDDGEEEEWTASFKLTFAVRVPEGSGQDAAMDAAYGALEKELAGAKACDMELCELSRREPLPRLPIRRALFDPASYPTREEG